MAIYKNAGLYLASAYAKLHTLGFSISDNYVKGYGNSAKQKDLWDQQIRINKVLRTLLRYSSFDVSGNFTGTYRITDTDFNRLLSVLIDTGDLLPTPTAPKLLFKGLPVYQIGGPQGPPGVDGLANYIYVGYAQDSSGTGFNTAPGSGRPYIAFKNSNVPLTVVAGIFSGLWTKYFGNDGVNGANGADGVNAYVHIGWADASDGTGFTLTFDSSKKYVAFLENSSASDPVQGDFAGRWAKYIGEDGVAGANGATILSGSGAPGSGLGNNGDFYIDLDSPKTFYGPKSGGAWGSGTSLKGDTGDTGATGSNGVDGVDGVDGANAFLYVAYADDASGGGFTTTFDANKNYIAFLSTDTLITSPAQSDFTGLWAKYRGTGDQWTTSSNTSLTIAVATVVLVVDKNLAWATGQRAIIAVPYDPTHRMEGTCVGYNPTTGQLTVSVDTIYSTGTFATWQVSLLSVALLKPISKQVATAGGTITLDFSGYPDVVFVGDAAIGANKAVAISNDSVALEQRFLFEINGGLWVLTFDSKYTMSDVRWDDAAKTWTPNDEGKYKAISTYDSVNNQWDMDIYGPYP